MSRSNPKQGWAIKYLAIDATGLKVYGKGEWKVKIYGTGGKGRTWRKLHLAVDPYTNDIGAVELSLSNRRIQLPSSTPN